MSGILDSKMYDYMLRAGDSLSSPLLNAATHGTPGTTLRKYVATIVTNVGETLPSSIVSITTSNATLSANNHVRLTVSNVPSAARSIRYFRGHANNNFYLIGTSTPTVAFLEDTGLSQDLTKQPPTVNTSGRPEWRALLWNHGKYWQRPEGMDQQWIHMRDLKNLGDTTYKNGDIISGCSASYYTTNKYKFTPGVIYLDGQFVSVPEAIVTLTGSGEEVVGVLITPTVHTYEDDAYIRNIDELVDFEYEQTGADRLVYECTWVLNNSGAIEIKRFVDGQEKQVTYAPERSQLAIELARQRHDTSGDFVVEKFPIQVKDHNTDATKLILSVGRGKAYPNGFEVQFDGNRLLEFNKGRAVTSVNNSGTESFSIPGGSVTGTVAQGTGFDLSGKSIKLRVGSGNYHTVTFVSNNMTAATVVDYIESSINSYGESDLVYCVASGGLVKIQAAPGKTLEIAAVASDAYTILGMDTDTYLPIGTRIYQTNNAYIKSVSDISYKVEKVTQVTHSGATHIDLLGENCVDIIGASITAANCHDCKYDYVESVSWKKTGNTIDFTLGGAEPAGGATYYVKWQQNYNPTKASRVLVEVIDAVMVKGAVDGHDNISLTSATSKKKVVNGATVSLSGTAKEVVEILRVNNSPGQSTSQYSLYSLDTNSTALTHEYSTIDWSAAGTPGVVGTGQPQTGATYYISYRLWQHAVEGDIVTADSYDSYAHIPMYASYPLRDCLDFRTANGVMPLSGVSPTIDYNFYLSRRDKLVIDDSANIRLITGIDALSPAIPEDQSGVQSLAVISIPPYTYFASEVSVTSLEVMRLTQKELQNVADRVTRLEYWNTVNDLEKEANNKTIFGITGGQSVAAEKQGIFTDALTGFGRCDLNFDKNGIAFSSSIDTLTRTLRLGATQEKLAITVDMDNSVHVREAGNTVLLDYQPECIEYQPFAGIWVNGAVDFVVTDYYGHLTISPQTDVFMDTTQKPTLNVDYDNNLKAIIDTLNPMLKTNSLKWGEWSNGQPGDIYVGQNQIKLNSTDYAHILENLITAAKGMGYPPTTAGVFAAIQAGKIVFPGFNYKTWTEKTTRTGTQQTLVPGSVKQSLGSRVVDLTLQGKMRAGLVISCDVVGLLPNADHGVTMNGIACNFTYNPAPVNRAGLAGTATYWGKTTVKTNNDGRLTATFAIPAGIPIGNATIRVAYYANPDISTASAAFYTAGFTQTKQNTTLGMSSASLSTEVIKQTGTVYHEYHTDPLAQSFFIDKGEVYIAAVGLYFHSKHSTLPFTVQIRNMVNGYPGKTVYASKTLYPVDIRTSTNSSLETIFTFDNVLAYSPSDYCFVAMPGGSNTAYNLFAAEVSTVDLLTGARIATQPASGVMFHSPNNVTWEAWSKRDLKYKIYKSNFENNCQIHWTNLTGVQASILVLAAEQFLGAGTKASWSYSTNGGTTWQPFVPFIDTELGSIITQVKLRVDVTSLGASYQIVSKYAGILLIHHNTSGWYVGNEETFTSPLSYPNKITAYLDIDAYGTNGSGITYVTPYASIDGGETLFELPRKVGHIPTATSLEPFYNYCFETPHEATITGATNATPIVITSAAHGFKNNMIVTITGVGTNTHANGDWRVTDATANTFELYSVSGVAAVGNGTYSGGGKIEMKEFTKAREFVYLHTSNRALTPKVRNISFIESRV